VDADRRRSNSKRAHTLDGAARLYIEYVRRMRPNSLKTEWYCLPRFLEHLRRRRVRDVRKIMAEHISSYVHLLATVTTQRKGTLLTEGSQATYRAVVRRFCRYLFGQSLILVNPAQDLVVSKMRSLPRAIVTEAQARRIVQAPSPWSSLGRRDRAILEVFYGSGIRAAECRSLDIRDVDLSRFILTVRRGKGRKDRVVPITGRAAAALDVYLRDVRPLFAVDPREQALFLSHKGGRLQQTGMQQIVVRAASAAGLPKRVAPHALRHACALHLLRGGADIRHVQALLGHRSLATTAIYTRVDVRDLQKVIARSHPRERRRLASMISSA
jgi:integrase/recombinase XerD